MSQPVHPSTLPQLPGGQRQGPQPTHQITSMVAAATPAWEASELTQKCLSTTMIMQRFSPQPPFYELQIPIWRHPRSSGGACFST